MGYVEDVIAVVERRNPGEVEFLQAVREVLESLGPVLERHKIYQEERILERIVEPDGTFVESDAVLLGAWEEIKR